MGPASNANGKYFQDRPNGSIQYTFNASQGASAFSVPSGIGSQQFSLSKGGKQVMTSLKPI
ncbi:hypothetical protein K435DRAFT_855284 [Dendrothele bispora CBS 962.96]|uniref:Uncharacterized protein n=1 Tax=Dendrothele bispora (strain CBS 962.96) TaxID=1314807 RepID=A0A4S8MCS7_DENBC|nr:hypothetical protein K435DRAFT_855284 [Dendrothele bispora CBS 962.96]